MSNYLINNDINFNHILLISETGEKIGIVDAKRAKKIAYEKDLDLVCINEKSNPVVCKIMDYSKFAYEQKKKAKEFKARQHIVEVKEIQLRPQIADHDLQVKVKKALEELKKQNRIKIIVSFKGRQVTHPELGFAVLNKFIELTSEYSTVFKEGKLEGKRIESILVPKK